jgi:hypothetical protein
MAIRLRTGIGILAGLLIAAALLLIAVSARTPTPSPEPEGIVPAIVHSSTNAASWLSGLAVEYAGSPLWTTIAGIAIIVLIVSLIMWLRRPRKPLDTESPM